MAIGDRYLATVEVTQVADTEYRWDGAGVGIFADEISSLRPVRQVRSYAERIALEATPHSDTCAFPDNDCSCRAIEIRQRIVRGLVK